MGKKRAEIIIRLKGDEILEKTASKFGTSAHAVLPKIHVGKKVKVITSEEVLVRIISKFGTGAHVLIPKGYAEKKIKIIVGGKDE